MRRQNLQDRLQHEPHTKDYNKAVAALRQAKNTFLDSLSAKKVHLRIFERFLTLSKLTLHTPYTDGIISVESKASKSNLLNNYFASVFSPSTSDSDQSNMPSDVSLDCSSQGSYPHQHNLHWRWSVGLLSSMPRRLHLAPIEYPAACLGALPTPPQASWPRSSTSLYQVAKFPRIGRLLT